jgi:ATP-binding cassette subfamily C protein CydCD
LLRYNRLLLAVVISLGFTGGLLTIWQAELFSRVVNGVFLDGQTLSLVKESLQLLIIIISARSLTAWASEDFANRMAVRVKNKLRKELFDNILRLGPIYLRGQQTGDLSTTIVEAVEALGAYFSQYLPQLVIASLIPLSILFFIFPGDLISGLVLLFTGPLIPVFMYLIGKGAEAVTKRQWDTLGYLGAYFLDSLQGLATLKELGRSKERLQSISECNDRFRDETLKVLRITFLSALVLELLATIGIAMVAVEISLRLLYGQLGFQRALFILILAPEFYMPLRTLGLRFHTGMSGTAAARKIFEIIDAREMKGGCLVSGERKPVAFSGPLRITNLSFTYPGASNPALQNISLEVNRGEHVAVVGPSGSGKSTLIALLLGFIYPTEGQININGKALTNATVESWRNGLAWVPQNPCLFHDTIAANLRIAKPDADMEEMDAAVKAACLDQFIHSLPDGYDTLVGEEGTRLSGGEAQRLALARAFLKNAPVLILDEPTSSLDPGSEKFLEEASMRLMQRRTVITIAHRLTTIYQADRIFVFEAGNLVETGTHRSLIESGGIYSRYLRIDGFEFQNLKQAKKYSLEPGWGRSEKKNWPESDRPSLEIHSVATIKPAHPFVRLLHFLNGSWGWVALSILLAVLTIGSNIGLMGTAAFLISTAALRPEFGALQLAIVGVRFFGLARGVFRYAERLTSHNVTFRLLARLRTWFYQALEPLAPARLLQYRSGDLLTRIIADVAILENFYVRAIAPPLVAVVIAAGMGFYFYQFSARMALFYLLVILVLGVGLPLISWKLGHRQGKDLVIYRAALQSRLVDGLQGLPDLLAFNRGLDFSGLLEKDGKALGQIQNRLASLAGLTGALTILFVNIGMVSVLAFSINLLVDGNIPGVMLAALALAAQAGFEAVIPLPQAAQMLSSSLQAANRLFEIVDTRPAVMETQSPVSYPSKIPAISFSKVGFSYSTTGEAALDDIDFGLPPGKHLAIVGPSGAGKSTLGHLLLRYWNISRGRILLDGCNIQEYAQDDVRKLFSVVSQKPTFFNETIMLNLLMAKPDASESLVLEAGRQACMDGFVSKLPHGYQTVIGERGLRLSGGERRRLALARAFLKNAPILLLDEPTADLDAEIEKLILETVFSNYRDRSIIFITHRLVGLEKMDEILVLDRGKIVERGGHAELLSKAGLYSRMWTSQERIFFTKV